MKTTSWKNQLCAGLFVLSGLMFFAGCGGETKPKEKSPTKNTETNQKSKPDSKAITITVVDIKSYANEIAKHKGKVVLVDFWANWCVNCKKAFPHTVKLHQTENKQGLDVISFCVGLPVEDETLENQKKEAMDFLISQKANFTNLITFPADSDTGYEDFEITDDSLPHYKLYGKEGKLIRTFTGTGEGVKKEIDAAVEKALAEN